MYVCAVVEWFFMRIQCAGRGRNEHHPGAWTTVRYVFPNDCEFYGFVNILFEPHLSWAHAAHAAHKRTVEVQLHSNAPTANKKRCTYVQKIHAHAQSYIFKYSILIQHIQKPGPAARFDRNNTNIYVIYIIQHNEHHTKTAQQNRTNINLQ